MKSVVFTSCGDSHLNNQIMLRTVFKMLQWWVKMTRMGFGWKLLLQKLVTTEVVHLWHIWCTIIIMISSISIYKEADD